MAIVQIRDNGSSYVVATLCTLWWLGLWVLHLVAIVYAKYKLHRTSTKSQRRSDCGLLSTDNNDDSAVSVDDDEMKSYTDYYAPVSIIKPLCGADAHLAMNLETFFTLNYPSYEILFCAHSHDDDAVHIVKQLLAAYPYIDARLFIGGEAVGVNPKVNNMMPAYRAAKHELILISDAGILMRPNSLCDMVIALQPDVAIVTQMPFTNDERKRCFAAALEKVYFGTMHARREWRVLAGMSSLMRRCALEQAGGMEAFGGYLAEDYFFAYQLVQSGWRCAIASQPAMQNHEPAMRRFFDRMCRWARLRQAMLPQTIVLEPLQDCILVGAIFACSISRIVECDAIALFVGHIFVWMLLDYALLRTVQNSTLPFAKHELAAAWLCRELVALPLVVWALAASYLQPAIKWRNGDYQLEWGGIVRRCEERKID